jgi:hypothetical protein
MPAPGRPRSGSALLPTLGLAVTIAIVVFGGYAVGGTLSRSAGSPVQVAEGVTIRPLSGWEPAGRFEEPVGVRLTRGAGNLDVVAIPYSGTPQALVDGYVREVLEAGAERLSVSGRVEAVRTASGLPGARIAYVGLFGRALTPIEGEITAIVAPSGVAVVSDGWGPEGVLRYIRGDVRAMTEAVELG